MSRSFHGWGGMNLAGMGVRKFRNFETSWAGPGRMRGEFCLGSEDGRILLTDDQLNPSMNLKESPLTSPEAVNGVAFLPNLIAVSTRCEVVFATLQPVNGKGLRSVFPAGAHGVITTPSGYCVAPLGRGGLMVVKPSAGEYQPVVVKRVSHKPADFYKVVSITYAGGEVLTCAARKDGVAVIPFSPEGSGLVSSLTYPGLDVVDVCSLGGGFRPRPSPR
jgi:hypothetical protein